MCWHFVIYFELTLYYWSNVFHMYDNLLGLNDGLKVLRLQPFINPNGSNLERNWRTKKRLTYAIRLRVERLTALRETNVHTSVFSWRGAHEIRSSKSRAHRCRGQENKYIWFAVQITIIKRRHSKLYCFVCVVSSRPMYSEVPNKRTCILINFWEKFHHVRSY